jgi:hypothetical protein
MATLYKSRDERIQDVMVAYTKLENADNNIYNIIFYKLKQKSGTTEAVPIRLWAGLTQILVDSGTFVGQSRIIGEEATTVYDLAIEYENIG